MNKNKALSIEANTFTPQEFFAFFPSIKYQLQVLVFQIIKHIEE